MRSAAPIETMNIAEILTEAKALRRGFKKPYLLAALLYFLIIGGYGLLIALIELGLSGGQGLEGVLEDPALLETGGSMLILSGLISTVDALLISPILYGVLSLGLLNLALERCRGLEVRVKGIFKPFRCKWFLLLLHYLICLFLFFSLLLTGIPVAVLYYSTGNMWLSLIAGASLCLIPLYYFFTHTFFAQILIFDKEMEVFAALKASHKAVKANFKALVWYSTLAFLQIILSVLLLFIPLIWIAPKLSLAYGLIYEKCFGVPDAKAVDFMR